MLHVSVGHEIFETHYKYYFDKQKIIKYLKYTVGHPDKPPKEAIIYQGGKVLWKNTDNTTMSPKAALDLFKQNMAALKSFSRY